MPYRRLPKTDAARLKALKTVIDNNEIYTVKNRFIDWKTLNEVQQVYQKLLTANQQYNMCYNAQIRNSGKIDKLQRNAEMYISHFIQVLYLAMQRGEIKESNKKLYSLSEGDYSLPNIKTYDGILKSGINIIKGEKARIKNGGRPIYNPTISMVATHYDIFKEAYDKHKMLQDKTNKSFEILKVIRPDVDRVLLDLWNQIEKHFEEEPLEIKLDECRKFGIVYYYRSTEKIKVE
ncbi:hypothetical protein [Xylanibacter oryzae]|uniref:hypothetical protein n=1 Tax=Xylanibacter oryzae TaxID=185293 RepID=UPI0004B977CB|nr:hypothetical protein [Xylanibacter oryzae]